MSEDIGSPFTIKEIQFSSSEAVAVTRRLLFFVSLDKAAANVAAPSGTNLLAFGGSIYFVPSSHLTRLVIGFKVPSFGRHMKAQFINDSVIACTVIGAFILEVGL